MSLATSSAGHEPGLVAICVVFLGYFKTISEVFRLHERKTFGERALLSTDPYVRWVSVEAGSTSPFSSQISRLLKAALGCPGGPPTDIMPLACYKQPKGGPADPGGGQQRLQNRKQP